MDSKALAEFLDQHRWLLNNGLVNDGIKNQLMFYGSIVHKDVQAVELDINLEQKSVHYTIYIDKYLLNKVQKYERLSRSTGLFGMWRFKRLLKKEGNLNFNHILNKFVKEYCGPNWAAGVEIKDIANYVEGYSESDQQPH